MTLAESSIYIDMKRLREMLYQAQFHMTKTDRIIYGTPLMNASGEALGAYVVAFETIETKQHYMDLCIGYFARLRADLEFCVQQNIIKFPKRTPKPDEDPNDPYNKVSSRKVELFALIAKIDKEIRSYRASTKGKTLCDN